MLKFSSDRAFAQAHGIKLGAFGSNTKRFENKSVEENKSSENLGPGYYNVYVDKTIAAGIN